MDSKGNIVYTEKVNEKEVKVTDAKTGRTLTMFESDLKAKFTALTDDQAAMLMQKSRAERRKWLREQKMKKVKRT